MSKITRIGDLGTPERHARRELVTEVLDGRKVARARNKLSYEILYARKTINEVQKLAAERLYENYIGSHASHNCEYKEPTDGGAPFVEAEVQLINHEAFQRALKLLDNHLKTLIMYVIVYDNPLNDKSMSSLKKKKRREAIREALDILAKGYNFC